MKHALVLVLSTTLCLGCQLTSRTADRTGNGETRPGEDQPRNRVVIFLTDPAPLHLSGEEQAEEKSNRYKWVAGALTAIGITAGVGGGAAYAVLKKGRHAGAKSSAPTSQTHPSSSQTRPTSTSTKNQGVRFEGPTWTIDGNHSSAESLHKAILDNLQDSPKTSEATDRAMREFLTMHLGQNASFEIRGEHKKLTMMTRKRSELNANELFVKDRTVHLVTRNREELEASLKKLASDPLLSGNQGHLIEQRIPDILEQGGHLLGNGRYRIEISAAQPPKHPFFTAIFKIVD